MSNLASATAVSGSSAVRVLAYNSMSANFDGEKHPGGTAAPFSQRRGPQLDLLTRSQADVIGVEEAAACLHKIPYKPCYRQVDSLADGLPGYKLDDTYTTSSGSNRYLGNFVLYNANVAPIGRGGTWSLGPSGNQRHAAYQAFRVVSGGSRFLFVNTHLWSTSGSSGDKIRGTETMSLLHQANAYAGRIGVTAIIYTGDFNSYAGEWHVNDITGNDMRAAHVADGIVVAQHHVKAGYDSINALYRRPHKGHGSADHVYATGGIGVKTWGEVMNLQNGAFVGAIPSDHNPVFADLMIPF
jgi:endonuclease/exonuclease/phosphatase family metal-dependent hydrolase